MWARSSCALVHAVRGSCVEEGDDTLQPTSSITMASSDAPRRVQYKVLSQQFEVDPGYQVVKELGQGAYGCVAAAVHRASGESIAIKKITGVFNKRILTKRALREIKCVPARISRQS